MTQAATQPRAFAAIERLEIRAWRDEVIEALGHDPRGRYARRYWLPLVGPSTLVAAQTLIERLERSPEGFDVAMATLGRLLGLPGRAGKANSRVTLTLGRLTQFGFAAYHATGTPLYRVRLAWPPLTARQLERLPTVLVAMHPAV